VRSARRKRRWCRQAETFAAFGSGTPVILRDDANVAFAFGFKEVF
jgi:hypothetical protein